jgi:hypothetical protein
MDGTLLKYIKLSDGETAYQFNLKNEGSKEFQFFEDIVMRQRDKPGSSPSTQQVAREVNKTEVVMSPCEYCNGLMPQTWNFCPTCTEKWLV